VFSRRYLKSFRRLKNRYIKKELKNPFCPRREIKSKGRIDMKQLKIPMSRVAVLIGHEGGTKRLIEEKTGAKVLVNSKTGDVTIYDEECAQKDPLLPLKVEYIIKAIARGFSPENALLLLRDDMYFKMFDIRDYVGKHKTAQRRARGRVIGEKGRTREIIEELTGVKVSVSGYSVSLIGDFESLSVAEVAVDMLLHGARHSTVYSFLEKKRREAKLRRLKEWQDV